MAFRLGIRNDDAPSLDPVLVGSGSRHQIVWVTRRFEGKVGFWAIDVVGTDEINIFFHPVVLYLRTRIVCCRALTRNESEQVRIRKAVSVHLNLPLPWSIASRANIDR